MNGNLINNRHVLLILGASPLEIEVVKEAQALGYYVIVTDNHNNPEINSPAKFVADEAWNISWNDTATLAEECKKAGVKGVLAGFSEMRVEAQIRLCDVLGLVCDTTLDLLEITRDKIRFKNLCRQYDVPVVAEYTETEAISNLPVIIKPTDRGGSAGIRVVFAPEEFQESLEYSKEASPSSSVIIEKYLGSQIKFDAYYIAQNGVIDFIASNDTLMGPSEKGHEICQGAWIFPSRWKQKWLETVHKKVVRMLQGIGLKNGYITISAFVSESGEFQVFETGLRLSGELSYKFVEKVSGNNYLDFLIYRSLSVDTPYVDYVGDRNTWMLTLNFFARNGMVSNKCLPSGDFVDLLNATKVIHSSENRLPLIGMMYLHGENLGELITLGAMKSRQYQVEDFNNNDLVAFRFDETQLIDFLSEYRAE